MYKLIQLHFNEFMESHWQTQPKLFRSAITAFVDPLDQDELAGLAQEADIDSRIVSRCRDQWQVHEGPFDDFSPYCQGQWSLLVQGVDQVLPAADALMSAFDFVPNWRKDNLMVSFSNAGGSVGPHLDQYDVFILQGKGRRRWRVGKKGDYEERLPHPKLRQISGFEAIIDEVLEPGDMIYIPPGFPHEGIAIEECMNYSIGFRAPDDTQLVSALADALIDQGAPKHRFQDPMRGKCGHPALVTAADTQALKTLMCKAIEESGFPQWPLKYLSQSLVEQPEPATPSVNRNDIWSLIHRNAVFHRCPGLRPLVGEGLPGQVFIEGEAYDIEDADKDAVLTLIGTHQHQHQAEQCTDTYVELLTLWVNMGYWYWHD